MVNGERVVVEVVSGLKGEEGKGDLFYSYFLPRKLRKVFRSIWRERFFPFGR